jgi:hypothetical protein
LNQTYSTVLSNLSDLEQTGQVTVTPYKLPKVPTVIGVEAVGEIENNISGTMVILPLRDTTLEIWTEGTQFLRDYNQNILPNFSFSP